MTADVYPRDAITIGADAAADLAGDLYCPAQPSRPRRECPRCVSETAIRAAAPIIAAQARADERARIAAEIEAAQFAVESAHHFHQTTCLCGFRSNRSRSRTEHITGALAAARIARGES